MKSIVKCNGCLLPIYKENSNCTCGCHKPRDTKKVITNKVGLTPDKKAIFKELMGSASSKQIDFNKVRDEYKDTYEERLIKSNTVDLRDNCIVHDLGNGFIRTEVINPNKTIKASKISKEYIHEGLHRNDFLRDYFNGEIRYYLTEGEVVEICYAIDKALDEYMIANNENHNFDMSWYETTKLSYDEYIAEWKESKIRWEEIKSKKVKNIE